MDPFNVIFGVLSAVLALICCAQARSMYRWRGECSRLRRVAQEANELSEVRQLELLRYKKQYKAAIHELLKCRDAMRAACGYDKVPYEKEA